MNISEITTIYNQMLKRAPTQGDINAHIHKSKEHFITEVRTCPEYLRLQNGLVSIVLPTRNRVSTFKRAIGSCLKQTYKNIEIIICDDSDPGYIDSLNYYNSALKQYSNITYIKNKTNLGFCKNINQGLKIANGSFITMLFDDDYYYDKYIESAVTLFNNNNDIGFVTTAAHNFHNGKLNLNTFKMGVQNYVGKLHKYHYFNGLINVFRNPSFILWSVSPCNYVFRNNGILLRENVVPGFDNLQLKSGTGYDLLYILDNLKLYDYFYVNQEHLVHFDSTQGSFTINNLSYVIDKMNVTIKYWVLNECNEPNVYLKLQELYKGTKSGVWPDIGVLNVSLISKPNTNKKFTDYLKMRGNIVGLIL